MCENLTQETIDCKLLRRQNETKADFIAQNWGRSDSESKARWCEQGERSTLYFSNLEKRNHSNKYTSQNYELKIAVTSSNWWNLKWRAQML